MPFINPPVAAAKKAAPSKPIAAPASPKPVAPAKPQAAPQKSKADVDEVAGYKITVDKLDIDESELKHDQPGGNPADREKQAMVEKSQNMEQQKKHLEVGTMKQNKDEQSSSFSIETSGLDTVDDDGPQRTGTSSLTQSRAKPQAQKSKAASSNGKDDGKMK